MIPKRRKPGSPAKAATPLDARQRAIAEQEAKLRAEMERCKKVIEEAPKIAEAQARQRREEFISRQSRTAARPASRAALPDIRYGLNNPLPEPRRRTLRSERQQGRLMFFVLLLIFTGVVYWVYYTVTRP